VVTFSWLQGNLYPGFGVLSLKDAHSFQTDELAPSFKLDICDLPPQMDIYMGYIILLGIKNLIIVLSVFWTVYKAKQRWDYLGYREISTSQRNRSLNSFSKYALNQLLEMAVVVLSFYFTLIFYIYFLL
jgi:hypothetical protein